MIKVKFIYKSFLIMVLVVLLTISAINRQALAADIPAADKPAAAEITIEALGGIDYDTNTNTTTASNQAKLTDGKIDITAELLSYHAGDGLVNASGSVTVTRKEGVYHTEKLVYNLKNETGSTEQFDGVLYSENEDRNIMIRGSALNSTHDTYQISTGAVTRCPREHPHYTITAKKITFQGNRVTIQQAILKIQGIPIFYFPRLSFRTDNPGGEFPVKLESGYETTDGLWLKGSYNLELNDNLRWFLSGKIVSNRSESDHQLETGLSVHGDMGQGAYNDTLLVNKKILGDYKLADTFSYSGPVFSLTADGSYDFSVAKKNEVGFSLTRKYWPSSLGKWQLGIEARRVEAYEGNPGEYGGIYGGYRLDYQPLANLTLSFLRLDDFNGKNNYGDFSPNLGSTVTLGMGKTLSATSRINISGSYNMDNRKLFGKINWTTCCYDSFIGWDAPKQAVTFGLSYNF